MKSVKLADKTDMRPRTEQWRDEALYLVNSVRTLKGMSRSLRTETEATQKGLHKEVTEQTVAVKGALHKKSLAAKKSAATIQGEIAQLDSEMQRLVTTRSSLQRRITAAKAPLDLAERRARFRTDHMPSTEFINDGVERAMKQEILRLSSAHDELVVAAGQVDKLLVEMEQCRGSMLRDAEEKLTLSKVDAACCKPDGNKLPTIVQSPRKAHAEGNTQTTIRLAHALISASGELRQRVSSLKNNMTDAVAITTGVLEKSVQDKVGTVKQVIGSLSSGVTELDEEIAMLEAHKAKLEANLSKCDKPLHDAQLRQQINKSARPVMAGKWENATEAIENEVNKIRVTQQMTVSQIARINADLARMYSLREQIVQDLNLKKKALAVNQRVLTIGHTPAPPSTARSSRTSQRDGTTGATESVRSARTHSTRSGRA